MAVHETSLVVQLLKVHLPMQGMWIHPWLENKDPSMPHSNQACTRQLLSPYAAAKTQHS